MSTFKFNLVNAAGSPISRQDLWGQVGFSESYSGKLTDADPFVVAIRKSISGEKTDSADRDLVRSFLFGWLARQKKLSRVAIYALPLPKSVRMLEQVGFLDRTVSYVAGGAASIALSIALLDLTWDWHCLLYTSPSPRDRG